METIALPDDGLVPAEFRVSRVVGHALGIFLRQFLRLFLLVAILEAASFLVIVLSVAAIQWSQHAGGGSLHPIVSPKILGLLLMAAFFFFGQLACLYGAFESRRGKPIPIGASLTRGLARILPVVGIEICMAIATGAGALLLLVPGLIAVSMLYVALPVCVVERRGPFASLARSIALTRHHRWRVFAIGLLVALAWSVGTVLTCYLALRFGNTGRLLLALVWFSLGGAFHAVVAAIVYHDLRSLKEGGDFDEIAAVFD
jgi:hypothetical protein